MKNKLLLLLILISGFYQSQNDGVEYKITRNNYDAGFINGNIDPWNVLISGSRMTFATQLGFTFYKKGLFVNASGDFHYLDQLAETQLFGIKANSIYKPQKSRNVNFTAGYLRCTKKNGKVKFRLKTVGKITYVANVNVDFHQFIGAEAGLQSGYALIAYNYEDKKNREVVNIKNYYTDAQVPLEWNFTTYLQYTWFQLGLSYGKIVNAEAQFEGFGLKKVKFMKKFYAHLLLPVSSNFEDVYYEKPKLTSSGSLFYRYTVNELPKSTLGFRFGYDFTPMSSGVGYGLSAGVLPGFKGMGNVFLATKVSIVLGKILK